MLCRACAIGKTGNNKTGARHAWNSRRGAHLLAPFGPGRAGIGLSAGGGCPFGIRGMAASLDTGSRRHRRRVLRHFPDLHCSLLLRALVARVRLEPYGNIRRNLDWLDRARSAGADSWLLGRPHRNAASRSSRHCPHRPLRRGLQLCKRLAGTMDRVLDRLGPLQPPLSRPRCGSPP